MTSEFLATMPPAFHRLQGAETRPGQANDRPSGVLIKMKGFERHNGGELRHG